MSKTMTLQELRDHCMKWCGYIAGNGSLSGVAADDIKSQFDAHLAAREQVNVGAIREVAAYLLDEGTACLRSRAEGDAEWGSRLNSMSRKLTRAISAPPAPNKESA